MNSAPEDPLARMARWDALRRRVDGQLAAGDPTSPAAGDRAGQRAAGDRAGPAAGDRAGQRAGGDPTGSPIDELAAATRRVVEQDPSASVMITVRSAGGTSSVRVAQVNGEVAVTVTGAEPPAGLRELPPGTGHAAAAAEPAGTDRSSQIIAELAELLRRDPSFLSRPR